MTSMEARATIGPPEISFEWRFAGGPIVARFIIITRKAKTSLCICVHPDKVSDLILHIKPRWIGRINTRHTNKQTKNEDPCRECVAIGSDLDSYCWYL